MNQKLFFSYQELFKKKEIARQQGRAYIKESSIAAVEKAHQRSLAHLNLLRFLEMLQDDELNDLILQKFPQTIPDEYSRARKISILIKSSEFMT